MIKTAKILLFSFVILLPAVVQAKEVPVLSSSPRSIKDLLHDAASQEGVPASLLSAICWVESNHRPNAVNTSDPSYGLCQLKTHTASQFTDYYVKPKHLMMPSTNVLLAARFLSWLIKYHDGNILKAVASYNAGAYAIKKRGIFNTQYVDKVLKALIQGR
jgi:soluble lytic murein transglycosylase